VVHASTLQFWAPLFSEPLHQEIMIPNYRNWQALLIGSQLVSEELAITVDNQPR